MTHEIANLLTARTFAVVGASRNPQKYGALVYRTLQSAGKTVYAVNPCAEMIGGDRCYPSLDVLPETPEAAVMVVPPAETEAAVTDCIRLGVKGVWMQEGAESDAAVAACRAAGITVVSGGPCLMVAIRTQRFSTE